MACLLLITLGIALALVVRVIPRPTLRLLLVFALAAVALGVRHAYAGPLHVVQLGEPAQAGIPFGALVDFFKTEVGQGLAVAAVGWLWGQRWWRSKKDARAEWLAGKAREWFFAIQIRGDREGWSNQERWRQFLKAMGDELITAGMKELSPAEKGLLGVLTQKLHWSGARPTPAPLPPALP